MFIYYIYFKIIEDGSKTLGVLFLLIKTKLLSSSTKQETCETQRSFLLLLYNPCLVYRKYPVNGLNEWMKIKIIHFSADSIKRSSPNTCSAALPAHGSCPCALIKSPFCTKAQNLWVSNKSLDNEKISDLGMGEFKCCKTFFFYFKSIITVGKKHQV